MRFHGVGRNGNGKKAPRDFVTLKDIADIAKVSVSTVSRAMSGTGLVNRRTELRIQKIAADIGYRPNILARGLVTNSSRLIGLMVHNLVNSSFQTLAQIAQARLLEANYQVLLGVSNDNPKQELNFLSTLFSHRVDGLILVPTGGNWHQLADMGRSGVKVVGLVRGEEQPKFDTILPDDSEGAYRGTKYLLDLGHRRIGIIVGRLDTNSGRERLDGYRRAMQEYGAPEDPNLIFSGYYDPLTGVEACNKLLDLPQPPTALFSANHEASFGAIKVLSERRIEIPDALSLLCYEDTAWFSWHKPSISAIDVRAEHMANLAVNLLLQQLNGSTIAEPLEASGQEYRVGARMIVRESCSAIAHD